MSNPNTDPLISSPNNELEKVDPMSQDQPVRTVELPEGRPAEVLGQLAEKKELPPGVLGVTAPENKTGVTYSLRLDEPELVEKLAIDRKDIDQDRIKDYIVATSNQLEVSSRTGYAQEIIDREIPLGTVHTLDKTLGFEAGLAVVREGQIRFRDPESGEELNLEQLVSGSPDVVAKWMSHIEAYKNHGGRTHDLETYLGEQKDVIAALPSELVDSVNQQIAALSSIASSRKVYEQGKGLKTMPPFSIREQIVLAMNIYAAAYETGNKLAAALPEGGKLRTDVVKKLDQLAADAVRFNVDPAAVSFIKAIWAGRVANLN